MNSQAGDALANILSAARDYCAWLERVTSGDNAINLLDLHVLLSRLQFAAAQLPSLPSETVEIDKSYDPESGWRLASAACKKLVINQYGVVFNPLEDRDAIATTLEDDLGDIYNDLRRGILLAERGSLGDALWHLRFHYFNHWGRHVVHAQTAVWQHLADGYE